MINITRDGYKLTVTGHAGYAPHGYDIVCAAVSSLASTLAGGLQANGELFVSPPTVILRHGSAFIECKPKKEKRGEVSLLWNVFMSGFIAIAMGYGGFVRFTEKNI